MIAVVIVILNVEMTSRMKDHLQYVFTIEGGDYMHRITIRESRFPDKRDSVKKSVRSAFYKTIHTQIHQNVELPILKTSELYKKYLITVSTSLILTCSSIQKQLV